VNVAITGACGLLGAHLAARLSPEHRVVGFDRHRWWGTTPLVLHHGDLTNDQARIDFLDDAAPDVLIHCAAMVDVDGCERTPDAAYRLNATLTRQLAHAVPAACRVVYITTDGIFDGTRPFRTEADVPCPRTVYGRSKLHGEWDVQLSGRPHLIVRTNFYGWSSGVKSSAAEWLWRALESKQPITLFDDFYFTPLYVMELVDRIVALMKGDANGVVHVVGAERVSKLGFGQALAAEAGLSTEAVKAGSIELAALLAPRPRDMSLRSDRLEGLTGYPEPSLREGLQRLVADQHLSLEARASR
jgi:dTDP-4-dehydrorhamnose reductase